LLEVCRKAGIALKENEINGVLEHIRNVSKDIKGEITPEVLKTLLAEYRSAHTGAL